MEDTLRSYEAAATSPRVSLLSYRGSGNNNAAEVALCRVYMRVLREETAVGLTERSTFCYDGRKKTGGLPTS